MTKRSRSVDVLIVGGGLVGASLAIALSQLPLSIAVVEALPVASRVTDDFDARSIALSLGSQQILAELGLWQGVVAHATKMSSIFISDSGHFGATRLHASDYDVAALGYVVEMQHLNQLLAAKLAAKDNIELFCPAQLKALSQRDEHALAVMHTEQGELTLKAKLVVAADGASSSVRSLLGQEVVKHDYHQCGIVANIGLARAHQHQAFERFTREGPVALLPMTGVRSSLVWVTKTARAKALCALDERDFLKQLQQVFGYRLGRLLKAGRRHRFPLQLMYMPSAVAGRTVFIGNAAHALHPVAGQGFNLGLRDVAFLAETVAETLADSPSALGGAAMLATFVEVRKKDQWLTRHFTDGLVKTFSQPSVACLRGLCMMGLDTIPVFKRSLLRHALGLAGKQAKLTCGIPL